MLISVLKSKLAYARITQTELYYVGSITIDEIWMQEAALIPNEKVHVVNLNNGERLETYVIPGAAHSGIIALNGPAARCGAVGDEVFILSYAQVDPSKQILEPVIVDLKQRYAQKQEQFSFVMP